MARTRQIPGTKSGRVPRAKSAQRPRVKSTQVQRGKSVQLPGVTSTRVQRDKSVQLPGVTSTRVQRAKSTRVQRAKSTQRQSAGAYDRTHFSHLVKPPGQTKQQYFRILSIDGGGARGMIPAVILKEIEERAKKPTAHLFDRICGTSTGAVLACGVCAPTTTMDPTPRFSASEIVEIYRKLGKEVFSRGSMNDRVIEPMEELADRSATWLATHSKQALETLKDVWITITNPMHDVHKLAYLLYEYFGDLNMKSAITELFVYAYDIGTRTPEVLGSRESLLTGIFNDYSNYKMYQAATASSAAPPFFAPYTVWQKPNTPIPWPVPLVVSPYPEVGGSGDSAFLVDGGNGALANPSLFAYLEPDDAKSDSPKFVLSLGCGHFQAPLSSATKKWGLVEWIVDGGELLKNLFDGESDVTDMAFRTMLSAISDLSYVRWQPSIPEDMAFMDEGSTSDMNALEDVAQAFISEHDEDIDKIVATLSA
jgi:uncharacterized protein